MGHYEMEEISDCGMGSDLHFSGIGMQAARTGQDDKQSVRVGREHKT